MRIRVRTEDRKSVAYHLAPEELTIILPEIDPSNPPLIRTESSVLEGRAASGTGEITSPEEFTDLVDKWSGQVRMKPSKVQLRNMRNKWASCSQSGNIVFNESLRSMPRDFAEYVILHELLHVKVPSHGKLFKNLLGAHMPDWQERVTRTIESVLGREMDESLRIEG